MSTTKTAMDALALELSEWRDAGGPVNEVVVRMLMLIDARIIRHAEGFTNEPLRMEGGRRPNPMELDLLPHPAVPDGGTKL